MKIFSSWGWIGWLALAAVACNEPAPVSEPNEPTTTDEFPSPTALAPIVITETLPHDSDDPAIWLNSNDVMLSRIIGTDKDSLGGLYAFDLDGKIVGKSITLERPNNVDVAYNFELNGSTIDYAITGERFTSSLRVFSMPDLKPIDNGGIPLFEGETGEEHRDVMGVASYIGEDGTHYAIVSRKFGPQDGTYLWQYRLFANPDGTIGGEVVRKFGQFSGNKEIEAIAVDHELGYVYYSDEQMGVRKYYAEPAKGNEELAFFGQQGFLDDHEGITICETAPGKGYIIVSDQGRNAFRFFPREGSVNGTHDHPELGAAQVTALSSDGSELTRETFNGKFPGGLFVAMSDERTFHFYSLQALIESAGL